MHSPVNLDAAINNANISNSTLIWAIVCSILLHALLAMALPNFKIEVTKNKPIELTIELIQPKAPETVAVVEPVQAPEPPKPEVIEPKPIKKIKPKELPKPVTEPIQKPSPITEAEPVTAPAEPTPNVIAVAPKVDSVPIAVVAAPVKEVVKPVEINQFDIDNALGEYGNLLGRAIAKHKSYPRIAQMRGHQGDVLLDIKLDGSGNVLSAQVKEGSGYDSLDKQALEMVRKASPFPAPPEALRSRSFNITVPVSFKLA